MWTCHFVSGGCGGVVWGPRCARVLCFCVNSWVLNPLMFKSLP